MERPLNDQADLRIGDIAALMRHARKSASYKPALLKALVRCCRESDDLHISLDGIGREFTRLYWNQTVVYHLRQAVALSKESTAVKLIRKTAKEYKAHDLAELPAAGRAKIDRQMSKLLTVNVLSAFHASRPPGVPQLYRWEPGQDHVVITPQANAFLKSQASALELVANFYWAEFLEGCNRLAPRIVQKVSRDGASRKSLQRYLKILREESNVQCFYCEAPLGEQRAPTVDHVIPWSFLLEDDLWDLVLACSACNSAKSDWLPDHAFIEKLLLRNQTLSRAGISLAIGEPEIERLYEAAISVEWPRSWSP
ncbi:MAG: HNH endonuclease signature motif containing protein [Candidatus Cybelea sp.]